MTRPFFRHSMVVQRKHPTYRLVEHFKTDLQNHSIVSRSPLNSTRPLLSLGPQVTCISTNFLLVAMAVATHLIPLPTASNFGRDDI